jgi:hypothetical protein
LVLSHHHYLSLNYHYFLLLWLLFLPISCPLKANL